MTPDTYHLMPETLEFLKGKKVAVKKSIVTEHLRTYIAKQGWTQRDRAIGWALNRLEKANLAWHPTHGYWQVTSLGADTVLQESKAREIVEECIARETAARTGR
jgi:restriction endonuclease Mrr